MKKKFKKIDEFKNMTENMEIMVEQLPTPEYFERIEDFYKNLNLAKATNKDRAKEKDRFVGMLIKQFRIYMKDSHDNWVKQEREIEKLKEEINQKEFDVAEAKKFEQNQKDLADHWLLKARKSYQDTQNSLKVIVKLGELL